MPSKHAHTIHSHQHHIGWDNSNAPALTVAPGTTVVFETVDASGAQLSPSSTVADIATLDFGKVNPVTGPVFIDGAEPPLESTSLIFPVVPASHDGIAEIALLNAGERDTSVTLNLWSFAGELLGATKIVLPAGFFYRDLAHYAFPGANFSSASHIKAVSKAVNLFSQPHPVMGKYPCLYT